MKNHYCFEIEFPGIDLNNYVPNCKTVSPIHHAHLYSNENEIKLNIYYDPETYFGESLSWWASKIDWKLFGSYIKISNENQNVDLKRIDISESKLKGIQTGSFDGNWKYVTINIDTIKFYWNPNKHEVNTAEFYFDNSGYKVVKDFYSTLFGMDNEFSISRMNNMDVFYSLDKAEFRPEYSFAWRDDKNNKEAIISKEPKIQFRYKENITEEEALTYGEVICSLASFYFHTKIDYKFKRINLPENTITIRNICKEKSINSFGGLQSFKNNMSFHKLLLSNWQSGFSKNFNKLIKVIELFNQSFLVEDQTEFVIRYNIIEICNNTKSNKIKFEKILNDDSHQEIYDEALKLMLQSVTPEEHELFKQKWTSMSSNLAYKPMISPLISFLKNQNLNPEEFPISVTTIKSMRDNIIHGSISKVDYNLLNKANILLYRVTGILILNLLGINEWELNKELK